MVFVILKKVIIVMKKFRLLISDFVGLFWIFGVLFVVVVLFVVLLVGCGGGDLFVVVNFSGVVINVGNVIM